MTDPARAQTVDTEIAKHCAFSLPGVALTLGRQNWHCLKDTYETLASDVQVGPRWIFNTRKTKNKQEKKTGTLCKFNVASLHHITVQLFSNCISWLVKIECMFATFKPFSTSPLSVEGATHAGVLHPRAGGYSGRSANSSWPGAHLQWVPQRPGWSSHRRAQTPLWLPQGGFRDGTTSWETRDEAPGRWFHSSLGSDLNRLLLC